MTILVSIHSVFRMWTIPAEYVDRLRALFPSHTILHARSDAEARRMIEDAEVAFSSQIPPNQLAAARRLRWIHSPAAGVGHMLFPEMVASPVVMTNSRGLSAETIAEHILAVVLALFRRLPLAFERQVQQAWAQDEVSMGPIEETPGRPSGPGGRGGNRSLKGSEVLIVGLGSIGAAAAARLAALGARVVGVRRHQGASAVPGVTSVHPPASLHDLLPSADVVVLTAAQTAATHSLIGAPEIARLKPNAVIVNVSRGSLLDEHALAVALREGRLGGAALDVFRDEPLEPGHALWSVPNLLVTPHTAGLRDDHWEAATDLFADNLRRYDRAEPLLYVVDKSAGY